MSRIEFREDRCKGCLICTTVCPQGIIRQSSRFNQQGYKVAESDPDRLGECTGCSACALICPDVAITVWKTKKTKASAKGAAEGSKEAEHVS